MEFYPLQRLAKSTSSRPSIRTIGGNKTVLISIPAHVAIQAGLSGASKVDVQLGLNASSKAVKITAAADGKWVQATRKTSSQIHVRELMPKEAVSPVDVDFRIDNGALILTLPAPWELENELVVVKTKPARRASK